MTHCVLRSPMSVQESSMKHTTVLCIALTEREKTGGSFQCLASVWRHFVPREGCGQLGPQSTGPLSQLVPWALSPLTNLLVDKFTWRPNKWSPIIATFDFMVSFTPWNEWCEAFSKYYTAESTGIQQMYPYQELIYVYHSNGTRAFTSGSLHPLALPQRKTKPNCEADVAWESVMSEVCWWERVPGRWSLASRHTTGKIAAQQIHNLGKDICLTDQKLKKMQTMRVKESESVNSEAASRHR